MAATLEMPKVTHTHVSGDLGPLHAAFDRHLKDIRQQLGRKRGNRIACADDVDGSPYEVVSPADRTVTIGTFVEASPAAVRRAIDGARAALPIWAARPWRSRVETLRKICANFERNKMEIAVAVMFEAGKPRLDALGEVGEAIGMFQQYCDQMEASGGYDGEVKEAGVRETAQTLFRPYGVFAAITPFNFPVALPVNVIVASLLAGNTVVFKPSPAAGLTGSLITAMFEESDLPPGAVNMLCGYEAGRRLADADDIDGFAFIGSHKVGMELLRKAAGGPYMRPVIGEMGGKNPAYVSASADIKAAAQGVAKSAFGGAGQKCTCCSVAYVHSSIYDAFRDELIQCAKAIRVGSSLSDRDVTVGPLINTAALERYEQAVAHARKAGRVSFGGRRIDGGSNKNGLFVEPTIVEGLASDDKLLKTELFVPMVVLVPFDDLGAALAQGNSVVFGLSAGFYGAQGPDRDLFLSKVEAGILYLNRPHGATTGGWPGIQILTGWKGSGTTGKGTFGGHFVPQFMRQQCRTVREV